MGWGWSVRVWVEHRAGAWSIGLEVDCEEGWGDGIGGAGERSLQSH